VNCPKCKKEMSMLVKIELRLPSLYANKLSKAVIAKKECKITAAMWSEAKLTCYDCGVRETGA
jgi:hypothetical protein